MRKLSPHGLRATRQRVGCEGACVQPQWPAQRSFQAGKVRPADPEFPHSLDLLRQVQEAGGNGLRIEGSTNRWFWIDDRDWRSKRTLTTILFLFTLNDLGAGEPQSL